MPFAMQNTNLAVTEAMATRILNACFAEVLLYDLHCSVLACTVSSVNYALGKHHVIKLSNILYLCQAEIQEITL